jgi:hypothetical protein
MRDSQAASRFASISRRAVGAALLLSPALAAAAGAAAVGQIALVEGDVRLGRGEPEAWSAARADDAVYVRDTVVTRKRSRVKIRLGASGSLTLGENTRLRITPELVRASGGPPVAGLTIDEGMGLARLDAAAAAALALATPAARVDTTGALVLIEVAPDGRTIVTALDGEADVASAAGAGAPVHLRAGERTFVEPGRAPAPPERAPGVRSPGSGTGTGTETGTGTGTATAIGTETGAPAGPGTVTVAGAATGALSGVTGAAGGALDAAAGPTGLVGGVAGGTVASVGALLDGAGLGGALPAVGSVAGGALDRLAALGGGPALGAVGGVAGWAMGSTGPDGVFGALLLDPGAPVGAVGVTHVIGTVDFRP